MLWFNEFVFGLRKFWHACPWRRSSMTSKTRTNMRPIPIVGGEEAALPGGLGYG